MRRRAYLGTLGAAVASASAGCLAGGSGGLPNTYLSEPDREYDADALPYPVHGDELPATSLHAPLHDTTVDLADQDHAAFVTFVFSHCNTVCPVLTTALRNVQTAASRDGRRENVAFFEVTFDPERDTAARLREYREQHDVAPEDWYFLRPADPEQAEDVVTDEFGVAFERTHPEEMDMYMFAHTALVLLANADGYVERAYQSKAPDWNRLYDDYRALEEAGGA
ncbi:SCO family protein [Haloarchaeobius sp. HRN-SO-5]|uniref:SCO family protein n=1 Tax=Haloarchaeobius sp. HRN-SO-5 TaxID=3446118 RepID=UPI003EBD09F9